MKPTSTLSLLLLLACTSVGGIAAAHAGSTCPNVHVFGEGHFSTENEWEWRFTTGPARLQAFWSVSDDFFPFSRQSTIVFANRSLFGWQNRRIAPFSGVHPDLDPFVSPDGSRIYFSSIRPVRGEPRNDVDLWMVTRRGLGWSEPVHLGDAVNSPYDELYPSVDLWGNLYFASDRNGQFDIYRSKRRLNGSYEPATPLGATVNTAAWEFNPEISPDGQTLLFVGNGRPDSLGMGDIFVSHRSGDGFTPARNLGPCVNSIYDEYHPTVLWWERKLVFVRASHAPGEKSDFFVTDLPPLH